MAFIKAQGACFFLVQPGSAALRGAVGGKTVPKTVISPAGALFLTLLAMLAWVGLLCAALAYGYIWGALFIGVLLVLAGTIFSSQAEER